MEIQKLHEILTSTKSLGDKRWLGFEEILSIVVIGFAPKFIKSIVADPNLKFVAIALKGKSFVVSLSHFSSKVNP